MPVIVILLVLCVGIGIIIGMWVAVRHVRRWRW